MTPKISQVLFLLVALTKHNQQAVDGANILMVPFDHGSHVNFFCVLGNALQEAGHNAHVLVSTKFEQMAKNHNVQAAIPPIWKSKKLFNTIFPEKWESFRILEVAKAGFNHSKVQATELITDQPSLDMVRDMDLDLMIMDGFDFGRYMYVLPYKLSIPFMTLNPRPDPWSARVPGLPSVEGVFGFTILDAESTILQRIMNLFVYLINVLIVPPSPLSPIDSALISQLVPEKENIGFRNLLFNSQMILLNQDIICLDFPRVSSPYYQFIGGLGAKPGSPLPSDLDKIMNDATHGVILLTFGSALKTLPDNMLRNIFTVSKSLKQTVLIRHVGDTKDYTVPNNVHMSEWLPQNDILAHPRTKLFITHGGNNGQLEAVYHGVPMLVIPMFGDQFYNGRRAEFKQYGKSLPLDGLSAGLLQETITELLENDKYSSNIKKCRKILRHLPDARKQAVFWVEHVLQFGGDHLRPYYINMPLWKYFMLDIILLIFVSIFVFAYLMKFCCKKCFRKTSHEKVE